MKKILFVPLDDRPCNLKFPKKIAVNSGVEIFSPPKELLGNFKVPGSCEKISSWIEENAGNAAALVVSADMLCYGGLVASRSAETSLSAAKERLSVISRIKKRYPGLPIYIFNILMRLSLTADSEENSVHWKDIFDYSVFADKAEKTGSQEDKKSFDALRKKIPEKLLGTYLSVRTRDHEINKACLDLLKDGHADYLVIAKEDCAVFGLHKREEEILRGIIKEKRLQSSAKVLDGADEMGMCMVAKAVLSGKRFLPKIAVRYSFGKGRDGSLYEDVPLDTAVSDHLGLFGIDPVEKLVDAENVFFVHSFEGIQKDRFFETEIERDKDQRHQLKNFCSEIVMMGEIKKDAFIADCFYANAGDREFIEDLYAVGDLSSLKAYAGWNTSSNSIGSALAAALLPRNRAFLIERYIEDIGYQSVVRNAVNELLSQRGISKFDLGATREEISAEVSERLRSWTVGFMGKAAPDQKYDLKVSLPWPRTFEVDCDIIFS